MAALLYGAVDGVRVCGIPAGLVGKMAQVHLMKTRYFSKGLCVQSLYQAVLPNRKYKCLCVYGLVYGLVPVSWFQQRLTPPRYQTERKVPPLTSCPTRPQPAPARPQDQSLWTLLCPCCRSTAGPCTGWTWTYQRKTYRLTHPMKSLLSIKWFVFGSYLL